MTLATVLGNTTFTGYSATEEATMRAAITQLYNNSATARATFDKLGTTGSPASLDFTNQSDAAFAFAGTGDVTLDPGFGPDYFFVDETGTAIQVTLERVLMHEVVHAIDGLLDEPDNAPSLNALLMMTDYRGSTVIRTNSIMNDLGETTGRLGYHAVGETADHAVGTEFTNNTAIDAAFFVNGAIDMTVSGRTTSDLLMGGANSDDQNGGEGNDFLRTFGGDDTLTGGEGNDFMDGGAGTDLAVFSGNCADYTVSFANNIFTVTDTRAGHPHLPADLRQSLR